MPGSFFSSIVWTGEECVREVPGVHARVRGERYQVYMQGWEERGTRCTCKGERRDVPGVHARVRGERYQVYMQGWEERGTRCTCKGEGREVLYKVYMQGWGERGTVQGVHARVGELNYQTLFLCKAYCGTWDVISTFKKVFSGWIILDVQGNIVNSILWQHLISFTEYGHSVTVLQTCFSFFLLFLSHFPLVFSYLQHKQHHGHAWRLFIVFSIIWGLITSVIHTHQQWDTSIISSNCCTPGQ